MMADVVLAVLELLSLPFDTRPGRRASPWLWLLWSISAVALLALFGVAIYAIAGEFQ
jgi:hypothetical protein